MTMTKDPKEWLANGLFLVMVGVGLIAFISHRWGWIRYLELCSHFQVQYLVINAGLLVFLVLTQHRIQILLAFIVLALQASLVVPWLIPKGADPSSDFIPIRVLQANLRASLNENYQETLEFIQGENPDFVALQEVTTRWMQKLTPLAERLPYQFSGPGLVVYSKFPLSNTQVVYFASPQKASLTGTLSIGKTQVTWINTHPWVPLYPKLFRERNRQYAEIIRYLDPITTPKWVMGDLNISLWSPYYRRFERGLRLKNTRQGQGILPTWPTDRPYLYIPIDHFLLSDEFKVTAVKTGEFIGSDHLPLISDIVLVRWGS